MVLAGIVGSNTVTFGPKSGSAAWTTENGRSDDKQQSKILAGVFQTQPKARLREPVLRTDQFDGSKKWNLSMVPNRLKCETKSLSVAELLPHPSR